ncbi:MAG: flagellin FliC3 [Lachnospiraceae bacterium]|jgi:flagellin|nr:flagellin FliC3 [Lachnospiraceae bacterium]
MKINYNASAVIANNYLNKSDNKLRDSLARLSSGLKVVNPKDNPSGLAMARRMNSQIENLDQATQNAGDGVSVIEIADGALSEIHEMLQRINELAVKASTGTITDDDRLTIDNEVQQLKEEITRIANETEFNGQSLLDGTFDLKGYTTSETTDIVNAKVNVKTTYYSDDVITGTYMLQLGVTFDEEGRIDKIDEFEQDPSVNPIKGGPDFPADVRVKTWDGNVVTIGNDAGFEMKVRVTNLDDTTVPAGTKVTVKATIDLVGFGAMDMEIGANEGQELPIRIPNISLENMELSAANLRTQEESSDTLSRMEGAIKYVSGVRSRLGAYQNRLEHTIASLDVTSENMTAAYSRIMDTDMAEEMTNYTTLQVLTQASTSVLAQANERPSQVLQLLQ